MPIRILTTGGTIDGLEYGAADKVPKTHKSLIPELLKQSKVTVDCNIDELMAKDSKFLTNEDRELIAKKCLDCTEDRIVITHGTATLSQTAKYLGRKNIQKTIVLLGSAIPGNQKNSDALFNLGAALTIVQTLPVGVYITMNGTIFSWDNVKKNLGNGVFERER